MNHHGSLTNEGLLEWAVSGGFAPECMSEDGGCGLKAGNTCLFLTGFETGVLHMIMSSREE